jgi:hypothetical protein
MYVHVSCWCVKIKDGFHSKFSYTHLLSPVNCKKEESHSDYLINTQVYYTTCFGSSFTFMIPKLVIFTVTLLTYMPFLPFIFIKMPHQHQRLQENDKAELPKFLKTLYTFPSHDEANRFLALVRYTHLC